MMPDFQARRQGGGGSIIACEELRSKPKPGKGYDSISTVKYESANGFASGAKMKQHMVSQEQGKDQGQRFWST